MSNLAEPIYERREQMFPKLTSEQIARLEKSGKARPMKKGELLFDQGDANPPIFIVREGMIAIVHPQNGLEAPIVTHHPGEFTGEFSTLAGRQALVRGRCVEDGCVIEITRHDFLHILQTDTQLSEIFLRAFILRRGALIAQSAGDVVLLGSKHVAATLRIQEFLARNGHPFAYVDVDADKCVDQMLSSFHVAVGDIPVVVCHGKDVLKSPTNDQLADCLGFNAESNPETLHDVIIVGAGPSGLAAAVYATTEGLDALVLEGHAPGGQAGSSSKIENYLGFPTGISGAALAARALTQAEKFGAVVQIGRTVKRIRCDKLPYRVDLSNGSSYSARAIVIASGVQYRKPDLPEISKYEGTGIYYGATYVEAQRCGEEEVAIVGGANSAGQAAVFLSGVAKHVHILVRAKGLSESMSRYLIRRIEDTPNITLHVRTQVTKLEGAEQLETITWHDEAKKETKRMPIKHLFLMTGASPNTAWLDGCCALDDKGFVMTGQTLDAAALAKAEWPKTRQPFLFETSLPGVFAVGDVRATSTKRVASAVGEGSVCISLVHRFLAGE